MKPMTMKVNPIIPIIKSGMRTMFPFVSGVESSVVNAKSENPIEMINGASDHPHVSLLLLPFKVLQNAAMGESV